MKNKCKKISALFLALLMLSSCNNSDTDDNVPVINQSFETTTAVPETLETTVTSATSETTSETAVPTMAETTAEPAKSFKEADIQEFSSALGRIFSDYDITGMSVAVFGGGEIIYTESLGYANAEEKILADDNTRYRIASPSKLVSTMILMKLVEEGSLSLDTILSEVTDIKYDSGYCETKVELWHLLTHTAGLFDTWSFDNEPNMKYDINRLMKRSYTGNPPGTAFNYSNFGSGSIGAIIERITGEYFHDYAHRVFFEPLGMDAGYVIDLIDDKECVANLYDHDGEILKVSQWKRNSEYYESFGLGNSYYTAQCELIITASDLARLGIALSGDGTFDGKRVLSGESVKAMNTSYFSAENFDMGLNVRIYDDIVEGRTIYGHSGNALGCITGLYYDPSDSTGIVFLTNHCLAYTEENGLYSALNDAIMNTYKCFFTYEE